jgi:hypothetical protein
MLSKTTKNYNFHQYVGNKGSDFVKDCVTKRDRFVKLKNKCFFNVKVVILVRNR